MRRFKLAGRVTRNGGRGGNTVAHGIHGDLVDVLVWWVRALVPGQAVVSRAHDHTRNHRQVFVLGKFLFGGWQVEHIPVYASIVCHSAGRHLVMHDDCKRVRARGHGDDAQLGRNVLAPLADRHILARNLAVVSERGGGDLELRCRRRRGIARVLVSATTGNQ